MMEEMPVTKSLREENKNHGKQGPIFFPSMQFPFIAPNLKTLQNFLSLMTSHLSLGSRDCFLFVCLFVFLKKRAF